MRRLKEKSATLTIAVRHAESEKCSDHKGAPENRVLLLEFEQGDGCTCEKRGGQVEGPPATSLCVSLA